MFLQDVVEDDTEDHQEVTIGTVIVVTRTIGGEVRQREQTRTYLDDQDLTSLKELIHMSQEVLGIDQDRVHVQGHLLDSKEVER